MKKRPNPRRPRTSGALEVFALLAVFFAVLFIVGGFVYVMPHSDQGQPLAHSGRLRHASEVWLPASSLLVQKGHKLPRRVSNVTGSVSALHLGDHVRISHDTFFLGKAFHPHHGFEVEGYAMIHSHERHAPAHGLRVTKAAHFNRSQTNAVSACSAPISDGTYWKRSRGLWIHPENTQGLSEEFIAETFAEANSRWQCALNNLQIQPMGPILGFIDGPLDATKPDGTNSIAFGLIGGRAGTIAVTITFKFYCLYILSAFYSFLLQGGSSADRYNLGD